MPEAIPTETETEQLLAFLPALDRPGRQFVKKWGGGVKADDGSISMPYPVYEEDVDAFFRLAGQPCWTDRQYQPERAGTMLGDAQAVSHADLASIRTMLTYCVRGERFCDGHWNAVLRSGQVVALLKRLQQLHASHRVG